MARREERCSFCAAPRGACRLLFRSGVGGFPPAICDRCVLDLAAEIAARQQGGEHDVVHTAAAAD